MKRIILLFVAISIISCKNTVNYDSSTYLTEEITNKKTNEKTKNKIITY